MLQYVTLHSWTYKGTLNRQKPFKKQRKYALGMGKLWSDTEDIGREVINVDKSLSNPQLKMK